MDNIIVLHRSNVPNSWKNFVKYVKENCDEEQWYGGNGIDSYAYKQVDNTLLNDHSATVVHTLTYPEKHIITFPSSSHKLLFELKYA